MRYPLEEGLRYLINPGLDRPAARPQRRRRLRDLRRDGAGRPLRSRAVPGREGPRQDLQGGPAAHPRAIACSSARRAARRPTASIIRADSRFWKGGAMRRALGALGAVIVSVAAGCATRLPGAERRRPAAPASRRPAPAPAPRRRAMPRSLAEAEPALLALEDRRAFDAADARGRRRRRADAGGARPRGARRGPDRRRARRPTARAPARGPRARRPRESAAFAAGILGEPALTRGADPAPRRPRRRVAARAAWSLGFLGAAGGAGGPARGAPAARAGRRAGPPCCRALALPDARRARPRRCPTPRTRIPRRPRGGALRAGPPAAGGVARRP